MGMIKTNTPLVLEVGKSSSNRRRLRAESEAQSKSSTAMVMATMTGSILFCEFGNELFEQCVDLFGMRGGKRVSAPFDTNVGIGQSNRQ